MVASNGGMDGLNALEMVSNSIEEGRLYGRVRYKLNFLHFFL